ncbi:MAG TPA: hypothetical protein VM469_05940 [Pseudoxanthomonas sp.]|nr:hypothetical protein [Pseudoxanthomonas sp.]
MEATLCSGCGAGLPAQGAVCPQCSGQPANDNRAADMAAMLMRRPPPRPAAAHTAPSMRWPHALSMLAAAVLLSMSLTRFHEPVAGIWPQLQIAMATALIPVLLGWFVLLFRRPRLAWAGFVIALGVMLWLQWQGKLLFELRERVFHEEATMVVRPTDDDDDPRAPMERSDAEIRRSIALAYQDAMSEAEARAAEFDQRRQAIPVESLLTPAKLTSRKGIQESRATAKAFFALAAEQEASNRELDAEMDQWVIDHVPQRPGWLSFLQDHALGKQMRARNQARFEEVQSEMAKELEGLYSLMEANLGKVQVQQNTFVFPNERALTRFNTHLMKLRELARREQGMRQQAAYNARQAAFEAERMAAP